MTVHDRRDKTLRCLACLYACRLPDGISLDVWMTDDGSADGTSAAVKDSFPDVRIIEGDGNLFWCRGMAKAWRAAAAGDYDKYLWLNDDTYLYQDALETLLSTADSSSDIIVGPVCSAVSGLMTYGGVENDRPVPMNGEARRVRSFNGNVVLVPRQAFRKAGFLDERFSHALGDIDYSLTAGEKGIVSVQAGAFVGTCEKHDRPPVWCDPSQPLGKRWKALRTPLGCNPEEYAYFDRKHKGVCIAFFHWCSINLRAIFPSLWKRKLS